jgi:hypothetical protein
MDKDEQMFIAQNFVDMNSEMNITEPPTAKNELTVPKDRRGLKRMSEVTLTVNTPSPAPRVLNKATTFAEVVGDEYTVQSEIMKFGKEWSFNVFNIYDLANKDIGFVAPKIYSALQIASDIDIPQAQLNTFYETIETLYQDNPYHNSRHGTEVAHATLYFCRHTDLNKYLVLHELNAAIVASFCHDVAHPGVNNRFLLNVRDKLAYRYNDASVLENMHAATVFKLLGTDDANFMANFETTQFNRTRKIIIDMILETDMAKHFDSFAALTMKVNQTGHM